MKAAAGDSELTVWWGRKWRRGNWLAGPIAVKVHLQNTSFYHCHPHPFQCSEYFNHIYTGVTCEQLLTDTVCSLPILQTLTSIPVPYNAGYGYDAISQNGDLEKL